MRQRNVKNQEEILRATSMYMSKETINEDTFVGITHDFEKVCMEIGMGKGEFIFGKAKQNPSNMYFGVELNKGVLSLAIKKIQRNFENEDVKIDNIKVTAVECMELLNLLPKHSIDELYLNFSDPWPKARHAKRRLTSEKYLEAYKNVLKDAGVIHIKTDNRKLFEFTIKSVNSCCMCIEQLSLNVYDDIADNVEWLMHNIATEYEKKFRDKGPIYALSIKKQIVEVK